MKTVIGDFSTKLADGTAVIIMIRPDDFDIISEADGNPGFPAHVSNSHNLGPLTHINLIPEGSKLVISARFLTKKAPKTGTKVLIRLDPSYAFVFPATLQT